METHSVNQNSDFASLLSTGLEASEDSVDGR